MIVGHPALAALAFLVALTAASEAQVPAYKQIEFPVVRDLAEGEWIETSGHLRMERDGDVFISVDEPSAQGSWIDISKIAADTVTRLKAECRALGGLRGCPAIVRGQIGIFNNHKEIIASEIQIAPR